MSRNLRNKKDTKTNKTQFGQTGAWEFTRLTQGLNSRLDVTIYDLGLEF